MLQTKLKTDPVMAEIVDISGIRASCQTCTLSELCLPRGLGAQDMKKFESIVKQRRPMQRGDTLYRSGDPFNALYAVKSGTMKTIMITPDGEEQIVGFHMPGELLGFDGLHDVHSCTAVAIERTSLCELPLNQVEEVSRVIPGLHRQLCNIMGRELNGEQAMLLLLARLTAEDRLAAFLLSLSKRFSQRGFLRLAFLPEHVPPRYRQLPGSGAGNRQPNFRAAFKKTNYCPLIAGKYASTT